MSSKKDLDKLALKKYFIKRINVGDVLTEYDLNQYVKKRKLTISKQYVNKLRDNILPTLLYKTPIPIKIFQTITVDRLGLLSMDFAYYHPEWKKHNKGYIGFLMVNSIIADKRWAIPMKSRKTDEFERAMEEVCRGNIFPAVSVVISDRETTITSRNFQKKMYKLYGIRFRFIVRYNKAWASENAIRHTKRALSISLLSSGSKTWVSLLNENVSNHNRKKLAGTAFSPNKINRKNFFEYINQLHDNKDTTMTFSTASIDSRSFKHKQWVKKLFKYRLGQLVFASKYSLKGRSVFGKQSVQGTYDATPFIIKRAKLRPTKQKDLMVPGTYVKVKMFSNSNYFFFQFINCLIQIPNKWNPDFSTHHK